MTSPELVQSWARTEGFLREARANVSQIGEAEFSNQLAQFDEFISHNELGLALDTLEAIAQEGSWESLRLLELLALAAASMGLVDRQRELDSAISKLRGFLHSTQLPPLAGQGQLSGGELSHPNVADGSGPAVRRRSA